ncbi:hypothetical protein [Melaminivora alkalimesophila]|uniref:Uncharacterized protein n=1 Tax=Melaminivora alkalimesophila TaxID=1165852 RepID=A0A317RAN1_9BURK|nr:hypothetical protein [Melaminivora alkalimesophila]PWW46382.1 hypothetical protein DFR36_104162 [Melaminivora alkalimesophila]
MRLGFGLVGLLVALAIVAVVARKQLGATRVAVPPAVQERQGPAGGDGAAPSVRVQGEQLQQQVQRQMEALMQQPRGLPDDAQ